MADLPSAGRPSPAPLRAALLGGDETAFLSLVSLHHPTLTRVARQRIGDPRRADAAVAATWRALLDGLGDVPDEPDRGRLLALLDQRLPAVAA